VKHDFIRVKGYVNVGPAQKMAVQGVFHRYSIDPAVWFAGITELVGIGWFNETDNYLQKFENYCEV
jgi:hypothetical protein